MTIKYTVSIEQAKSHLFNIKLSIPKHKKQQLTISLPAWIPGSYMIRDFAKNIIQISAKSVSKQQELILNKIDKQTWQLDTQGENCEINYQVYAFDTSVRTAFLDDNRAFFNGTSVFLQVSGFEQTKQVVEFISPNKAEFKIATGLQRAEQTKIFGFGEYMANDYAELIDCPVEIADFDCIEFEINQIPHYLILTGKHYADKERVKRDLTKLCQHHVDLFEKETGGVPPFKEYWFLTNILPNSFGGLEHKNSTALLCSNFDFANKNRPNELTEGYRTFLSLASHEYFHTWNVCRIKPVEFIPYQTQTESYTTQLWAYEGITSYYDDLSLYRTGIISFTEYLSIISKTYTRVYRGSGELKQTLNESSFYTWTKFYKQAEDAVNNITSYYTKGSLVALWMDLTIRKTSQGEKSLDDLMRHLWQNFGMQNKGTQETDFIEIFNQLTGQDNTAEFKHILNTPEHLLLTELLDKFGIKLQITSAKISDTLAKETDNYQPYLGAIYKKHNLGLQVMAVIENSPAEKAGINPKDILIAIDNLQLDAQAENILQNIQANTEVKCHLFRDSQLIETQLVLSLNECQLIELTESDKALSAKWQQII
ncbi:M61 family metallopeptidase [Catenovulum maritimum]|uniref:PDZ domain-containing protein n=1 Tax=Catenovulum maritimum TaxID=1513271 RepID=A0A0J8GVE8_9ALTE|nr:PDZ domain-containing protein [Catenovulum maritimum]KMT65284.1 hypothetical protein XM47_09625 [Catenovulum maritimum]